MSNTAYKAKNKKRNLKENTMATFSPNSTDSPRKEQKRSYSDF